MMIKNVKHILMAVSLAVYYGSNVFVNYKIIYMAKIPWINSNIQLVNTAVF